jgi:hypothetical protein
MQQKLPKAVTKVESSVVSCENHPGGEDPSLLCCMFLCVAGPGGLSDRSLVSVIHLHRQASRVDIPTAVVG